MVREAMPLCLHLRIRRLRRGATRFCLPRRDELITSLEQRLLMSFDSSRTVFDASSCQHRRVLLRLTRSARTRPPRQRPGGSRSPWTVSRSWLCSVSRLIRSSQRGRCSSRAKPGPKDDCRCPESRRHWQRTLLRRRRWDPWLFDEATVTSLSVASLSWSAIYTQRSYAIRRPFTGHRRRVDL